MDFEVLPDTSLLQSKRNNAVMGGVLRQYDPIEQAVLESPLFRSLVQLQFQLLPLQAEAKQVPWIIEVYQIRIVTATGQPGQPRIDGIARVGNMPFIPCSIALVPGRQSRSSLTWKPLLTFGRLGRDPMAPPFTTLSGLASS